MFFYLLACLLVIFSCKKESDSLGVTSGVSSFTANEVTQSILGVFVGPAAFQFKGGASKVTEFYSDKSDTLHYSLNYNSSTSTIVGGGDSILFNYFANDLIGKESYSAYYIDSNFYGYSYFGLSFAYDDQGYLESLINYFENYNGVAGERAKYCFDYTNLSNGKVDIHILDYDTIANSYRDTAGLGRMDIINGRVSVCEITHFRSFFLFNTTNEYLYNSNGDPVSIISQNSSKYDEFDELSEYRIELNMSYVYDENNNWTKSIEALTWDDGSTSVDTTYRIIHY